MDPNSTYYELTGHIIERTKDNVYTLHARAGPKPFEDIMELEHDGSQITFEKAQKIIDERKK